MDPLIAYLTGSFRLSTELQCFWMAFQGSMTVRSGLNRDRSMHWFHAFMASTLAAYAGATFANIWMGRPTSMLSNDLNFAFCIVSFVIVNKLPFDLGYRLGKTLPVVIVTTLFAQLFRAMGVIKFCDIAHHSFRDAPSGYYPTPVFGPILFATMLGNMGGFFSKGFHGHLKDGMPWPFQNGFFCATFYHFFVHDVEGIIGITLREMLEGGAKSLGMDNRTFAMCLVSGFMNVMGILQLPRFFGPKFTPFNPALLGKIGRLFPRSEVKLGPKSPVVGPPPVVGGKKKN